MDIGSRVAINSIRQPRHGEIGEVIHIDSDSKYHVEFRDGSVESFDPWEMTERPPDE